MTEASPYRSQWNQLSAMGKAIAITVLAIALILAGSGAVIWRSHMGDDLYWVGIGLVATGGGLMWLLLWISRWLPKAKP